MYESGPKYHKTMTKHVTRKDAKNRAKEYATPISDLIRPNEVSEDAVCWCDIDDDVLDREIWESVDIIMSESHWHSKLKALIYERAVSVYCDDLARAPLDHLTFDNRKEAVKNGYQPYECSNGECRALAQEAFPTARDIPTDIYRIAHEDVSTGLHDGMQPTCEC